MEPKRVRLAELSGSQRAGLVADAARAIRSGQLVVLPMDTVYGLAGGAHVMTGLRGMAELAGRPKPLPDPSPQGRAQPAFSTWHAPSGEMIIHALGITWPLHRRLIERLLPGPVRVVFEAPADIDKILVDRLGVVPGAIDGAGVVAARVPDHPFALEVLAAAGAPVVAERFGVFGMGTDRELSGLIESKIPEAARGMIAFIVDDGPTRYGRPSTSVLLKRDGGYEIAEEGALEARTIRRLMERVILFVCTGNTCRSPMAEALARSMMAGEAGTRVISAGTSAVAGEGATPEAVKALEGMGVVMGPHRSKVLSRQLIADAEVIYVMAQSHKRAVLAIDPEAAKKVQTLDPSGQDIPDPIGTGLESYRKTAERMAELIRARFNRDLRQGAA